LPVSSSTVSATLTTIVASSDRESRSLPATVSAAMPSEVGRRRLALVGDRARDRGRDVAIVVARAGGDHASSRP